MIGVDCFNARKALNAPLNEQLVGCVLEKKIDVIHVIFGCVPLERIGLFSHRFGS